MFMELSPHEISQLGVSFDAGNRAIRQFSTKNVIERMFVMKYVDEKIIRGCLKCGRADSAMILKQLIEIQKGYPEYESPTGTVAPEVFFMVFGNCYGVK